MNNDLLFPILPREGKPTPVQQELKVERVAKEAKVREVSDEESSLSAEERQQRQQQQRKKRQTAESAAPTHESDEIDPRPGHLDIYV